MPHLDKDKSLGEALRMIRDTIHPPTKKERARRRGEKKRQTKKRLDSYAKAARAISESRNGKQH